MGRASLLAVVVLSACSGTAQRSSQGPRCDGDRTVIVNNRSNRDADIVADRQGGGAPFELGVVPRGRQEEITLPPGATTARIRTPRDGAPTGNVDLRYGCRR